MKRIIFIIAILGCLGLFTQQTYSQSFKSLKERTTNAAKGITSKQNETERTNTSPDAKTTQNPNITKPENIKKENILVAVGKPVYGQAQGTIFRSVDNGASWQNVFTSFDFTPVSVAYGNERFVAISSSKVAISFTGEEDTWTEFDISKTYVSSGNFDPVSIVFGNGFFVVCGNSGTLCYSKDGVDWKYIGEPDEMNLSVSHFKNVEFIFGKFYVTGNCNRITSLIIVDDKVVIEKSSKFSTDAGDYCSFVASNGNNYIGGRFSFFKSKDGLAWKQYEPSTSGSSKLLKAICLGDGTYVVAKEMGGISFSNDNGANWLNADGIKFDDVNAPHINSLCIANGKIVAVGMQCNIWTSINGVSWTEIANSKISETRLFGIVYAEIGN